MPRACPFCEREVSGTTCPGCGRDPTASRRPCARCGKMTPTAELACCHCGERFRSDLRWKILVIIALFVAAFVLSVFLQVILD